MANSFTGTINTNGEFKSIDELTGLTLTSGKTYTIQVQNMAEFKVDNAIFTLYNDKFTWTQGLDTAYLKTGWVNVVLTVLENA